MYEHTHEGRKTHRGGESVSFGKLLLTFKAALEIWSERGCMCVLPCVCVCMCMLVRLSMPMHMAADQQKCKHKLELITLNYPVFLTSQPVIRPASNMLQLL